MVLPPKLAPIQVVIIPIYKTDEQLRGISKTVQQIVSELKSENISVKYDDNTKQKPGWKFAHYELKGIPLRINIGPRDLENNTLELVRRDTLQKQILSQKGLAQVVLSLLEKIQSNLFEKASKFRENHTTEVETFEEFQNVLKEKTGFISAHWDGTAQTEQKIKELTKATIRCIPQRPKSEKGLCVFSGKPSKQRVLFAKAY